MQWRTARGHFLLAFALCLTLVGFFVLNGSARKAVAAPKFRRIHKLGMASAGWYRSPDGEYVLVYNGGGEWSPNRFALYKYRNITTKNRRLVRLLVVSNFNVFAWVPKRPHSLVFAVAPGFGKMATLTPFLGIWEGGRYFRVLRRGSAATPDLAFRVFFLRSFSVDGKVLAYQYMVEGDERSFKVLRYLTLPSLSRLQ